MSQTATPTLAVAAGVSPPIVHVRPGGGARHFAWSVRLVTWAVLWVAIGFGGPLLQTAGAVGFGLALLVDLDGLLRHMVRPFAIAGAIMAGAAAGPSLAATIGGPAGAGLVIVFATSVVAYIVTMFGLSWIIAGLTGPPWIRALNHAGGCVFGAAEGVGFVLLLFWLLTLFASPVRQLTERVEANQLDQPGFSPLPMLLKVHDRWAKDPAASFVASHNPLERVPHVRLAADCADIASDRTALEAISKSAELRQLVRDPELQAIVQSHLDTEALRDAVRRGDIRTVLNSPEMGELTRDERLLNAVKQRLPELRRALQNVDHAKVRDMGAHLSESDLRTAHTMVDQLLNRVASSGELQRVARHLRSVQ